MHEQMRNAGIRRTVSFTADTGISAFDASGASFIVLAEASFHTCGSHTLILCNLTLPATVLTVHA